MTHFPRLLLAVTFALGLLAAAAAEKNNRQAYAGFIVTEAATGRVLFEENADVSNPPASMAKLMTFAVLLDKLAGGAITLQTPVRITVADSRMGGTQVFLDPRETFPVEELIYAMMIQSANDAAHALARAAGGSVEAFVVLMNAKARELGMTHTTFCSPHGLPPASRRIVDGDLTTPRDFAVLCRYLVRNTDVLKYTSIRTRDFGMGRKDGPQHMINHNNLLGKVTGVDGLKTGYTEGAGYCLSATAERNGRRVIAIIMGSFGPNGQVDKGKTRDLKAIELIEQGFAALPAAPAVQPTTLPQGKTGAPDAASQADMPTVKTEKTAAPARPEPVERAGQNSTAPEPAFIFRVIPPQKKP